MLCIIEVLRYTNHARTSTCMNQKGYTTFSNIIMCKFKNMLFNVMYPRNTPLRHKMIAGECLWKFSQFAFLLTHVQQRQKAFWLFGYPGKRYMYLVVATCKDSHLPTTSTKPVHFHFIWIDGECARSQSRLDISHRHNCGRKANRIWRLSQISL